MEYDLGGCQNASSQFLWHTMRPEESIWLNKREFPPHYVIAFWDCIKIFVFSLLEVLSRQDVQSTRRVDLTDHVYLCPKDKVSNDAHFGTTGYILSDGISRIANDGERYELSKEIDGEWNWRVYIFDHLSSQRWRETWKTASGQLLDNFREQQATSEMLFVRTGTNYARLPSASNGLQETFAANSRDSDQP